jgi:hypothetical protein
MIREALQYIVGMSKPEIVNIDGKQYSDRELFRANEKENLVKPLQISTLTGLVDYIKVNPDKISEKTEIMILVNSESSVTVMSNYNDDAERHTYIKCNAITPRITFESFMDTEKFNIMLQSCFLQNPDRDTILRVIGTIKEENVKTTGDNGISQSVVAKTGLSLFEEVIVPNPVTLIPFRTFIEVEQPESKFVFRMKDGPSAALYEADGGEWRLASMLRIKAYLENKLSEIQNVKILA